MVCNSKNKVNIYLVTSEEVNKYLMTTISHKTKLESNREDIWYKMISCQWYQNSIDERYVYKKNYPINK